MIRTGKRSNFSVPLSLLLLTAAALLAYSSSFTGKFVYDDINAIVTNPHIRSVFPLSRTFNAPENSTVRDRPLVSLTLALNYAWGELEPFGYHLFNLIVHILAGWTLFGILRRTLVNTVIPPRFNRSATGLALSASVIWTVHPIQTESVTYIIQRSESLAGLFYLAVLYCFIRSARSPRRLSWLLLSVIFCALGMATKPTIITVPLTVFFYDVIFLSRSFFQAVKKHWRYYCVLSATFLIQVVLISRTGYGDIKGLSPLLYLLTQPGVIVHYIRIAAIPHSLCFDYGWPLVKNTGEVILPAIFVGALLWITIYYIYKKRPSGFIGAWFLLILIPTSSILPLEDPAVEHRLYLSLAALITLVVIAVFELTEKIKIPKRKNRLRIPLCILTGTILILLTYQRNLLYRNPVTLWEDVVTKSPEHPRGFYNLGVELTRLGKKEEALRNYRRALELRPDYADAHNNLGAILNEKGSYHQAISHFGKTLRINPFFWRARFNMGLSFIKLEKFTEAITCFKEVVRLRPNYDPASFQTGEALFQSGKIIEALPFYRNALSASPDYAPRIYNRGVALFNTGRRKAAAAVFRMILKTRPDYTPAGRVLELIEKSGENPRID